MYDTNVGDVARLSSYFNPRRWTVDDLNNKFGIQPQDNKPSDCDCDGEEESDGDNDDDDAATVVSVSTDAKMSSLVPKLLIYPEKAVQSSGEQPALPKVFVTEPTLNELEQQQQQQQQQRAVVHPLPSHPQMRRPHPPPPTNKTATVESENRFARRRFPSWSDHLFPPLAAGNSSATSSSSSLSPEPSSSSSSVGHKSPDSLQGYSLSAAIQSISRSPPTPVAASSSSLGPIAAPKTDLVSSSSARSPSSSPSVAHDAPLPPPCLSNLCHPLDELALLRALWQEKSAPLVATATAALEEEEGSVDARLESLFDWPPEALLPSGIFREKKQAQGSV